MIAILLAAGALALPNPAPLAAPPLCKGVATLRASAAAPALLVRPRTEARALKLTDLPKANKEIAVARSIDGCAIPVGISYRVEGDGRFAADR